MVNAILADDMIRAGARAVEALDAAKMHTDGAFWLLLEDSGWRLVLSVPSLERSSPSATYEAILRVLQEHHVEGISVSDLSVAKSGSLYVQLLRSAVNVGGIGRVRFTGNVVNGHFIQDALIYRMEGGAHMRAGTVHAPTAPMAPGTSRIKHPRSGESERGKKK